jgi:hypothetical protein
VSLKWSRGHGHLHFTSSINSSVWFVEYSARVGEAMLRDWDGCCTSKWGQWRSQGPCIEGYYQESGTGTQVGLVECQIAAWKARGRGLNNRYLVNLMRTWAL